MYKESSPLTRSWFIQLTKRALELANIDATRYSGHSFRIGAATAAAVAGVPAHFIKMLGRWQSEADHPTYCLHLQAGPCAVSLWLRLVVPFIVDLSV